MAFLNQPVPTRSYWTREIGPAVLTPARLLVLGLTLTFTLILSAL